MEAMSSGGVCSVEFALSPPALGWPPLVITMTELQRSSHLAARRGKAEVIFTLESFLGGQMR
jgi:hypothetical protein